MPPVLVTALLPPVEPVAGVAGVTKVAAGASAVVVEATGLTTGSVFGARVPAYRKQ